MSQRLIGPKEVTDQEARRRAEPAALATFILCCLLILAGVERGNSGNANYVAIVLGIIGIAYCIFLYYVVIPSPYILSKFKWFLLVTQVVAIFVGFYLVPFELRIIPLFIMVMVAVIDQILWDRRFTYLLISLTWASCMLIAPGKEILAEWIRQSVFFLMAVFFVEILERFYASSQKKVLRLQAINEFSRHISKSLEKHEVTDLIGTAIKNAMQADTYFYGLMEGDQLNMQLIYDDGEFYPPETISLDGSLSGWVIRNQKSLFIADLRNEVDLEGVKVMLMGQNKASLCWMGVPLSARHIQGIIAVASYIPNNFSRTDLELLENIAQQAALVLDNVHHHAEVEAQSRLDSLTGVYNHGYFVNILNRDAKTCFANGSPLSLIMLDIDFFK